MDYYFNIFQPDIVVLDAAEYVFDNAYFNQGNMEIMDLNPAIINSDGDYLNQIDLITKESTFLPIESKVRVINGEKVDEIMVDIGVCDVKYAYLITQGGVLDLKLSENELYKAASVHNQLKNSKINYVFFSDKNGRNFYANIDIVEIANSLYYSNGTSCENENIVYTTDIKDNEFHAVMLQLFDNSGSFLSNINFCDDIATVNEKYVHMRQSGWYKIRLKVNTNLQDEFCEFDAYLREGEMYYYSFEVNEFNKKKAIICNYRFY